MATLAKLVRTTNRTIRRYPYILWFGLLDIILILFQNEVIKVANLDLGILPILVSLVLLIYSFYLELLFQIGLTLYGITSQTSTKIPGLIGILQASNKFFLPALGLSLLFTIVYGPLVLGTVELSRTHFQSIFPGVSILGVWNYVLSGIALLGTIFPLCALLQGGRGVFAAFLQGWRVILRNFAAIFPVALVALLTYTGLSLLQLWRTQAMDSVLAGGEDVALAAALFISRFVLIAAKSLWPVYFTVLFSIFYVQLTKEGSPS